MGNCSGNKTPLKHSGTSQAQRMPDGMKQAYVQVDEKQYADWIVFAGEYARFVHYYGLNHTVAGNWQPFFAADISAKLGIVAIQDIEQYRTAIKQRFDYIRDDEHKTVISHVKQQLNELFSALFTLSQALDNCAAQLPGDTTLKASLRNSIVTKLAPAMGRLIGYYKFADTNSYLDKTALSNWKILNQQLTDAGAVIAAGLSNNWIVGAAATWSDYYAAVASDDSVYNNPMTGFADEYLSIEHAANHNLFTGIFDTYLSVYASIITEAEKDLQRTLENYDAHPAHYALFLAFLRLFRFAQAHINTITKRHLDFYYRDVLRLEPKPAEANKVHVIGELAKQVDEYLLAKGTALKAGKDSQNKDVVYQLDADTVLNKAKVAQLKTFYKATSADTIYVKGSSAKLQDNAGRVFASPVANSEDGNGAELTSANKEWPPYVHKVYKETQLDSIAMPKAQIGFAIASHYLYLTEGERKVFVRFVMNPLTALNNKHLELWLTTEKGWYKVPAYTDPYYAPGKKLSDNSLSCAELSFTIPGSAPAIVNYTAKVHGGAFNCTLPILKVYLVQDDGQPYEYDLLSNATISNIEIRVEVGMDGSYSQKGLKNLLLSNDFGALDASKPFMPFGGQPKKDAGLVIGNKEIFSKKNSNLKFNIEWAELSAFSLGDIDYGSEPPNYPSVRISVLSSGIWKVINSDIDIFDSNTSQVTVSVNNNADINVAVRAYDGHYSNIDASTTSGFLQLSLNDSFGHQQYLRDLAKYLIDQSKPEPTGTPSEPTEPYTPRIKSIYAGYSAYQISAVNDAASFDNREIRFFHLYPFGEAEQHKQLQGSDIYLLPQFNHLVDGMPAGHIGEFYIGIEKLLPQQSVNLLFQVMEGTSDPRSVKPPQHIAWFFLANNQWLPFDTGDYSDATLNLVQSGIISFAIPAEATTTNTLLPAGYVWIMAAITEAPEAVCKLINIDAQASVATFADQNNADDFLDTALPAGTVAKLKIPDAAIKKISQPYASFGGRAKETDEHFYIRVSERLRHKARAITAWDYERLVLEAFPELYKVKCLNHTQVDDGVYNEVKPGYVSIITIPSLKNRNDANPLKPYTQQSTLTNIELFLKPRTSCFVQLRACQPQFEEVRLAFSLKLHDGYSDFAFYAAQLQQEITAFLSPWAYGSSSTLDFGGTVYKSVLINFIEERYYVDFITDVYMYVKVDDTTAESADMDEINASTARSILVSAPATAHTISEITVDTVAVAEDCNCRDVD